MCRKKQTLRQTRAARDEEARGARTPSLSRKPRERDSAPLATKAASPLRTAGESESSADAPCTSPPAAASQMAPAFYTGALSECPDYMEGLRAYGRRVVFRFGQYCTSLRVTKIPTKTSARSMKMKNHSSLAMIVARAATRMPSAP